MGTVEPIKIDVDKIEQTLKSPQYARVAQSLSEIGMFSATDLFSTYAGKRPDLDPWMADAMINRDRNLRLQYLAGLGLNLYQSDVIYADMLKYATRYPEELFVGVAGDDPGAAGGDRAAAGEVTRSCEGAVRATCRLASCLQRAGRVDVLRIAASNVRRASAGSCSHLHVSRNIAHVAVEQSLAHLARAPCTLPQHRIRVSSHDRLRHRPFHRTDRYAARARAM